MEKKDEVCKQLCEKIIDLINQTNRANEDILNEGITRYECAVNALVNVYCNVVNGSILEDEEAYKSCAMDMIEKIVNVTNRLVDKIQKGTIQ